MQDFAAIPYAIITYCLGLFASFHFSVWAFSEFQDSQLIITFSMGILAALLVKLFISWKFQNSYFGNMALLFIGIILGISAVFSFARNLGIMACGLPYLDTFTILSATALIFGSR